RVLRGEFPRFGGTLQALRLPAAHPAALRCLRWAGPRASPRSFRSPADECTAGAWSGSPGISGRHFAEETTGSPRFLGNPDCPFALVRRRRQDRGHQTIAVPRRGPRYPNSKGSHERSFGARDHGFRARCPRCAVRVAHAPRRTRFQPWVRLSWAGFPPAGFRGEVSECQRHLILLSQACLAQSDRPKRAVSLALARTMHHPPRWESRKEV